MLDNAKTQLTTKRNFTGSRAKLNPSMSCLKYASRCILDVYDFVIFYYTGEMTPVCVRHVTPPVHFSSTVWNNSLVASVNATSAGRGTHPYMYSMVVM